MLNKGAKAQAVGSIGQAQTHSTIKIQISTQNLADNPSTHLPNHLSIYPFSTSVQPLTVPQLTAGLTYTPSLGLEAHKRQLFVVVPRLNDTCCHWQQWVCLFMLHVNQSQGR